MPSVTPLAPTIYNNCSLGCRGEIYGDGEGDAAGMPYNCPNSGVDGDSMPGLEPGELALVSVFLLGDHGLVISSPRASVSPVIKSVMN